MMEYSELLKITVMLAITISVFLVLILGLKKIRTFAPSLSGNMKIIEGVSLGGKSKLIMVEVNKRQLLVGVSEHTISLIQEVTPYQIGHEDVKNSFKQTLTQMTSKSETV